MMRPELDDTLAARGPDPAHTATAPRALATDRAAGLSPGQQLGHFRIEQLLGAGGMGEVYLATDLALDRPVAIKVLPGRGRARCRAPRSAGPRGARAGPHHPPQRRPHLLHRRGGRPALLRDGVRRRRDARRAGRRRAAAGRRRARGHPRRGARAARSAAHRHHPPRRQAVEPDDRRARHGQGARLRARRRRRSGARRDGPVAQTSLAGTPLYMAPEQARGEPVDFRADIYALGATLFHLVVGRAAVRGRHARRAAVAARERRAPGAAAPQRPAAHQIAAIDALCRRMMAPRPGDRFASYDELIRAIELASVEHMRPAGLWVRTIATVVDLMITAMPVAVRGRASRLVLGRHRKATLDAFIRACYLRRAAYAIVHRALRPDPRASRCSSSRSSTSRPARPALAARR